MSKFFKALAVSNTDYPEESAPSMDLGFRSTAWIIKVDAGAVEYSHNGLDPHGVLYSDKDFQLAQDEYDVEKIWFKQVGPTPAAVRVWAWIKQR